MASSHESLVVLDLSATELERVVAEVAESLAQEASWRRVRSPKASRERLRVSMNLFSWGEVVTLEVEQRSVRIRSRCSFPLQVVDWGKNRKNVDLVRKHLAAATTEEETARA